jgi:phosphopantetheinyl transferase
MTSSSFTAIAISPVFEAQVKALARDCSSPILLDIPSVEHASQEIQTGWLSVEEQQQLNRYTFAKRRREWLAGRISAKIAIREYLEQRKGLFRDPDEVIISNSDNGRPFARLAGPDASTEMPKISISHSGNIALALASVSPCGVDIQKVNPSLIKVKERFCKDSEEHLLLPTTKDHEPLLHLALLWAAKEAVQKASGDSDMPGFLDLVLTGIEPTGIDMWIFILSRHHAQPVTDFRVLVTGFEQYGIGICFQPKGEKDA